MPANTDPEMARRIAQAMTPVEALRTAADYLAADCMAKQEEIVRLRDALAWAYQAIGARWPNQEALDNLSAVLRGEAAPHEWPVVPPIEQVNAV